MWEKNKSAELASVLAQKIREKPDANVIFLRSHGVVIGGENVEKIQLLLYELIRKLKIPPKTITSNLRKIQRSNDFLNYGYVLCNEEEINLLATNKNLLRKIQKEWALYPDHVVFLGAEPVILERNFLEASLQRAAKNNPPFIFSVDDGVYQPLNSKAHHKVQLLCYYDVIIRQEVKTKLSKLNQKEVFDLINWDSETHRQNMQ